MCALFQTFIYLCLTIDILTAGAFSWAEESVYPEGSSSIIQTRSWQLSGSDPVALHSRAKATVTQMAGVVLVKAQDGLLVISLPTPLLSELRDKLTALGTIYSAEENTAPQASTTLLRVSFQASSASS